MKANKEELASLVKSRRKEKGYTQSKLAELTGLSLRSIQRIEKAEVYPRDYSLNGIMEVLEIPKNSLEPVENNSNGAKSKRIILSISSGVVIFLLAMAFISQSRTFPETNFEFYIFWSAVVIFISFLQWWIWNKNFQKSN